MENINQIKKPIIIDYTEKEIEDYKYRLGYALSTRGISCDDVLQNSNYKVNIISYTQKEIIDKKHIHDLARETYRMANTDVKTYGSDAEGSLKMYPVINRYKGHNLISTIIFTKGIGNDVKVEEIPVRKNKLIII